MAVIVLADGCFDVLHPGHVAHLKAARALGDFLYVALTDDAHVGKGRGRPFLPWAERAFVLSQLRCVDSVMMVISAEEAIYRLHPHIYVKGIEYIGRLPEQETVERLGGRVVFLDTQPVYSSTKILTGEALRERIAAIGSGSK